MQAAAPWSLDRPRARALRSDGLAADPLPMDVSDEADVVRGVKAAQAHRAIDILVNNVGIHDRAPLAQMTTEWAAHNVQVNGIGPGYFAIEMTQSLVDDATFNSWICDRTPAGRWGRPEELVGAAVFLASPASSFVNGQILYVDGGLTAAI